MDGIQYLDREMFLKADFTEETSPVFMEEVEAESCHDMFASWKGIMMGNGAVWIGEVLNDDLSSQGLKIIEISGISAQ